MEAHPRLQPTPTPGAARGGHYEQWNEEHETDSNTSRWISTEVLNEFLDRLSSALSETSCEGSRRLLIGEIEEFLKKRCIPGHVVFGPHKRFPENQLVRCDGDFWKEHFEQIIKCHRCRGISDHDRDFFLEQKLSAMKLRAERESVSRDAFENSEKLKWRDAVPPGAITSKFEKEQQILRLQKALLDLRVFRQDFNSLIAKVETRVTRALEAVEDKK